MSRPTRRPRNVKKLTLVLVGAALVAPAPRRVPAQAPPPSARSTTEQRTQPTRTPWSIARVDSALAQARRDWDIPGMAVAIVRGDSVLLVRGYGVRELGKPGDVDANTLFDAASLTKSFTSATIATLVDEGRMTWDDPVRRHLPGLELANPYLTSEVTLRDLLSHRAGLEAANAAWYFDHVDQATLLRRVRFLRPAAPFRTALVYSNIGYTIAGAAAAAAGGAPWEELVRTRLLVPLGMTRTTASFAAAGRMANVAAPHAMMDGAQRPIAREGRGRDVTGPAGAVQSSAADLARWLRFQLNGGTLDGKRVVSEAALLQTQASQLEVPTTPAFRRARQLRYGAGYGMGWQVWDYRGRPMLWHTGSGDGQLAYMAIHPEERLGIVVLVNSWVLTSVPPVHGTMAGCIADALLALAEPSCSGDARAQREADPTRWQEAVRTFAAGRIAGTAPSRPLAAYAGTYADSLYGALHVRVERGALVLQVGDDGEVADLTHWHLDTFLAAWRRPFQRAYFSARANFRLDADGAVSTLALRLRNNEVTAGRVPAPRP
jgi:CubicO group peptidase (beta-lactamase class C family)